MQLGPVEVKYALALAIIIRHDYESGALVDKDRNWLKERAGVGRDRIKWIIGTMEEMNLIKEVRKNFWQVGTIQKSRGATKNIIIDEDKCDFTSVKTVVRYLQAALLEVKKDQLRYNSSLKFKANGYGVGDGIVDLKTMKGAVKRLKKLGYDQSSLPSSGFDAELSRHFGQSYNTIAKTLGFSRSKAVYFIKSLEQDGLLAKKKTQKLVYVGADAATVLKFKYENGLYTQYGQSYVFLNKSRNAILANFSNQYEFNLRS